MFLEKMQMDRIRALLPGFSVGYLIMRSLPAAAVSAGWGLSASLGAGVGDALSAVIFLLGCAVMITAEHTEDSRICAVLDVAAGGLYFSVSPLAGVLIFGAAESVLGIILAAIDLLTVLVVAVSRQGRKMQGLLMAAAVCAGILTAKLIGESACHQILPALSASMLAGCAVMRLTALQQRDAYAFLAGMGAVMLVDLGL